MLALCGLYCAEYVQECVGSVINEEVELGFQIFIVPSQDEERNVSLETRFQWTEKTSRACSWKVWMG